MKIPEGWPTREMIAAGADPALIPSLAPMQPFTQKLHEEILAKRFNAMLSAAPTPPETINHGNLFKWCHPGDRQEQRWLLMFDDRDRGYNLYEVEADAIDGFNQAEDRGWNCHLFSSVPRVAPTPPEVEPVYQVMEGGAWCDIPKSRFVWCKSKTLICRILYTSPPSPKASWDAEGNPLNLDAAAEEACKFLESYCVALETLGKSELPVHEGSLKKITTDLRKFLKDESWPTGS